MKVRKWLTINKRGSARLTQGRPDVSWDEVSVYLEVNLPKELFEKPRLEATINIPEETANTQPISVEVIENVKEAIKTATGLTFSINVIKEEKEND